MIKQKLTRIIIFFFLLFLLDLKKPFYPILNVEFVFLGILFISFKYPFIFAITTSVICGYLLDCLHYDTKIISLIEFPVFTIAIYLLLNFIQKKEILLIISYALIILIHLLIQNTFIYHPPLAFSITFFYDSLLLFSYFMLLFHHERRNTN